MSGDRPNRVLDRVFPPDQCTHPDGFQPLPTYPGVERVDRPQERPRRWWWLGQGDAS